MHFRLLRSLIEEILDKESLQDAHYTDNSHLAEILASKIAEMDLMMKLRDSVPQKHCIDPKRWRTIRLDKNGI